MAIWSNAAPSPTMGSTQNVQVDDTPGEESSLYYRKYGDNLYILSHVTLYYGGGYYDVPPVYGSNTRNDIAGKLGITISTYGTGGGSGQNRYQAESNGSDQWTRITTNNSALMWIISTE